MGCCFSKSINSDNILDNIDKDIYEIKKIIVELENQVKKNSINIRKIKIIKKI